MNTDKVEKQIAEYHTLTDTIYKERILDQKVPPDLFLNELATPSKWNNFAAQLKRSFELHNQYKNEKSMRSVIAERLCEMDENVDKESTRRSVYNWTTDKQEPDRENLFKLSFALDLQSPEEVVDLLSKGRYVKNDQAYAGFNVKNVKEAIILYCFNNHPDLNPKEKYKCVKNLLKEYNNYPLPTEQPEDNNIRTNNDINTTMFLFCELLCSKWESDDIFLKEFLLPNKRDFTGFSKTAVKSYRRLRQTLMSFVISRNLASELQNVDDQIEGKEASQEMNHLESTGERRIKKFTNNVFTSLQKKLKESDNVDFWKKVANEVGYRTKVIDEKGYNSNCNIYTFREHGRDKTPLSKVNIEDCGLNYFTYLLDHDSYDVSDSECELFLENIFPHKGETSSNQCFIKEIFKTLLEVKINYNYAFDDDICIPWNSRRKSIIYNQIVKFLPLQSSSYDPFNIDCNGKVNTYNDRFRNALVLMYYLDFVIKDYSDDFYKFKNGLDALLFRCGMTQLYPGNPFDAFIMYCIRGYCDGQDNDYFVFIISKSFEREEWFQKIQENNMYDLLNQDINNNIFWKD